MSKFKNTEELEKAYKELEREFTKKSQKLAEVEKTNYVTLLHKEMDSLLNDYAKRRISDLEAKLAEKDAELLQKENKIQDLMLCEFVATTLDFNKLSADNCRLREQLAMQENTITNLVEDNRASQEWYKKQLAEQPKAIVEKIRQFVIDNRTPEMIGEYKDCEILTINADDELHITDNVLDFLDNLLKEYSNE